MIFTDRVNSLSDYQDLNYSYDANGNVMTITDAIIGQTQNFTYDALDRLSTA